MKDCCESNKILLIPLGLSECDKKEYKCLAKGILHELRELNPNHIVFFSTVEAQNSTLKWLCRNPIFLLKYFFS